MKQIKLQNTDLMLSRLGFGTASIHHIMNKSKRLDLLAYAYELGFTHFDTARMYGDGMAEKTLGEYFSSSKRDKITITTKFGINANPLYEKVPILMYSEKVLNKISSKFGINTNSQPKRDLSLKNIEKSLEKSLKSLKTDRIDIYSLHEPQLNDLKDLEKLVNWLENQKQLGKILNIGLSGNANTCVKIKEHFPDTFNVLQVEDSIEDNEADILLKQNLPLQLTFGYMRLTTNEKKDQILKEALKRNTEGCILISTRNKNNLLKTVEIANQEG